MNIENIMYISSIMLQVAGAVILIIKYFKNTRETLLDEYFPGTKIVEQNENQEVDLETTRVQQCIQIIYENRIAFIFIKNYLQQVQKIDAVITNKMIEREQWLTLASSLSGQTDGERVKSSGSNQKMEDSVVMAIDAARDIDKYVARLRDVKNEISEVIQQIPVKEYNVLHKLYIQGKDLDDVAADNKKSYSWASTMHGRALAHVQGVLDTLEALPENSGKYRFRKGLKL